MPRPFQFDASYYDRFYGDLETRVTDTESHGRLVDFILAYLAHIEMPVRTVLDLGCGIGLWRDALSTRIAGVEYRGVEISEHICQQHGFEQGSVVDFRAGKPFDLVICQGVLQYLDGTDAKRALDNLAKHTKGALYLEALTKRDWDENCDRSTTDGDVYLRTRAFYHKHLHPHFVAAGGGLFLARTADAVLFELETLHG